MARSVLGRGLKPLMEEAQVVTGIPTLSVDQKAAARPETATVTPTHVSQPLTKTESRSISTAPQTSGPSIYRRKSQSLPVGNGLNVLPRWPFWVADVVLVGGALAVWLLAPRPMSLGTIVLAASLIIVGAIVAVIPWLSAPAARSSTLRPHTDSPSEKQRPPLQRLPFRLQ